MSGEVNGIITATGDLYFDGTLDDAVIIKFKEEETDVWYIYSLSRDGSPLF